MKNKIYIFLAVLVTLFSCESDEEFLRETPKSFYTTENAFSSIAQVDQLVLTLYQRYRFIMLGDNSGTSWYLRNGKGTDISDVTSNRISATFQDYSIITPEHAAYSNTWRSFYDIIAVANTAIYAANLESIHWDTEDQKNATLAQAKFFRGLAYMNLGELYGGVPIIEEVLSQPKYDFVRSTRTETYQFAINDMESALDDVPERPSQGGRVTKGAIQHYLCELYLALGIETGDQTNYDRAIQYADEVIDGGTYSLMTNRFGARMDHEPADVHWDLFRLGNVNYEDGNRESVWTWQIDFDAYKAEDSQSHLNYARRFIPVLRVIPGIIGTAEDVGGRSVARIVPTYYVRDSVWNSPASAGDMRNASHNIQRIFYGNDPNDTINYGNPIPDSMYTQTELLTTFIFPLPWKFSTDQFMGLDQGENRSNLFRDEYIIRLPETILLRAEAYYRKGDDQRAADDINLIRSRAQCNYLVTPQEVSIDFILDERVRELLHETNRWNTLLRMGGTVAVDRIRKYAFWQEMVQATLNFDFNLWPIPQSEIDRNKDLVLQQNPGWN